jgi:sugar-specific transcriptional regulator TrmB
MSEQTDKIYSILEPYGLTSEESRIYLDLLENNTLSALQISRNLHIGRTKVYRLLDKLILKELVVQKLKDTGLTFIANPPSQLELLLTKKEGELATLRTNLPKIIENLENQTQSGMQGSQTLYYRGLRGLSQVNWNLCRAKGEFLSYEVDNAEAYLPKQEAEDLRARIVDKKIKIRSITNLTKFNSFTNIVGLCDLWTVKHVGKKVLDIKADIFIYNNVYAVVNYLSKKDIFCVEIYNQNLADMQRQLFEHLWSNAKKFKVLDDHGAAELIK